MTDEPTRVTVPLIPKSVDALAALVDQQGLSRTDIINRALQLYAYISGVQDHGAKVLVQWPGGDVEGMEFV